MEEKKPAGTGMVSGRSGTVDSFSSKSHRSGETEEELLKCGRCAHLRLTLHNRGVMSLPAKNGSGAPGCL